MNFKPILTPIMMMNWILLVIDEISQRLFFFVIWRDPKTKNV